jgi:RNA polymerase sigma-70 factor (ECF subfamily)
VSKPIEPDQNPPNAPDANFPATRWTLVARAGGDDQSAQPTAIAELARLYCPALKAHLLQTLHYDEHRAADLLQGFLADKMLGQHLIGRADPQRGRFRTFLLAALHRYVIDEHRRDSARRRLPRGQMFDIDEHRDTLASRAPDDVPADAFDLAWARQVLGDVLSTMRRQCEQTSRPELWEVFEVRYLRPAVEGIEPEAHESIARRLKLGSAHQAANLLITARRMFTRMFKAVVSRYAATEEELRDELSDLWRIFASAKR